MPQNTNRDGNSQKNPETPNESVDQKARDVGFRSTRNVNGNSESRSMTA